MPQILGLSASLGTDAPNTGSDVTDVPSDSAPDRRSGKKHVSPTPCELQEGAPCQPIRLRVL